MANRQNDNMAAQQNNRMTEQHKGSTTEWQIVKLFHCSNWVKKIIWYKKFRSKHTKKWLKWDKYDNTSWACEK